jgi:hypothetical protein
MTKHDRTGAREGPEGSDEAKPIEIGPEDYLQESEATEIITATAASLGAGAALYSAYLASRGDRSQEPEQEPDMPEIDLPPGVERD